MRAVDPTARERSSSSKRFVTQIQIHTTNPTASRAMFEYLGRLFAVLDDVLLQRYHCKHLPHRSVDVITENVRGKTIIVTGPTAGIGIATARSLAKRGARVILACRTPSKGEDLVRQWTKEAEALRTEAPECRVMKLDLDSLASVRAFAKEFRDTETRLDVLVNNAGIFDMSGAYVCTKDGHEQHLQANFLAPALLTMSLLDLLKESAKETGDARVIFVSSKLHELCGGLDLDDMSFECRAYGSQAAYASSKLAEVLFVKELDGILRASNCGTRALVLHPGNIVTNVVRTLPKLVQIVYRVVMRYILLNADEGARCTLYCATSKEAARSGTTGPYFTSECVERTPSKQALETGARRKLWAYTLKTLGLSDL